MWVAGAANRDLRHPLLHRHRLVQMQTRLMNQLHVVLNEGVRRKKLHNSTICFDRHNE